VAAAGGANLVTFTLEPFQFFVLPTRTRFPFRYGIASMTDVPQLFAVTRVSDGRQERQGLAGEGLPPKWFTKDPATTFEQDLPEMIGVITHAAGAAAEIARTPIGYFDLWRELDRQQSAWAASRGIAPLLAHLGVSLVERAVLDGLCRLTGEPLHRMISSNRLGLRLGEIYPELGAAQPADLLPSEPIETCRVRHTVGLADALTSVDLPAEERVVDGLPQDLEASIRTYGLQYFKVKLFGDPDRDFPRLRRLVPLLEQATAGQWHVTVDGNENFHDFAAFRDYWERARGEPALRGLWPHVVVVEQPVHRDQALEDDAGEQLRAWPDRPPLIIDESDGAVGDVPRALSLGYAGASHKNCKGIVKGIANAARLRHDGRQGRPTVLTGEDLCTLGPVALLQDLSMMALLGITHVERNGHHYYRGLSMLPPSWQEATLDAHADLYRRHEDGFACLRIAEGRLDLRSVNAAPFGVAPPLDPAIFTPLQEPAV
jgi:hypothetical protein